MLLVLLGISSAYSQHPAVPGPNAGTEQDCGLTISGKILDHDTRSALIGATVYIPQVDRATVADEYGNYHFHHLCQGNYTLKVTYIGYETESFSVKLATSTVRDLQLHTDATTLRTVEITGSQIKEEAQSSQVISGRELEETRGLSLAESLKGIAGVTTIQTGPTISKPVIHGMHSNRVLLLNNGVRQEGQQWGAEHAPEIDPFVASEMKVIKGAAGVRYGSDAIGGVVIVQPAPLPAEAGLGGEVNLVGTTNNRQVAASATLQGKLSTLPLSWRMQGTFKKAGNARTPDYYLENTGFEEQNFSGALGYKKERFGGELFYSQFNTKLGILKAAHIRSPTDLLFAIEKGQPDNADQVDFTYEIGRPYQDVQHQLLKAKAFLLTGEAGKLEFVYGLQRNLRQEFDAHRKGPKPALELDLITQTTEAVWEHAPIGNFSGSVGLSTMYQNNTYEYNAFLPYFTGVTAGAFAIEKWRKDRLQLEAGLRYDYKHLLVKRLVKNRDLEKPEFDFGNVSGTLGAMYDLGYHLTFGLSATSAWRAPNTNELFSDGVHHSSVAYEKGDPTLRSEQAYNFEASVDYYANKRLNGKLSVYHNFIDNYIYLAPTQEVVLEISGAFPLFRYKQTNATFTGFDLSMEYNLLPNLALESKTSVVRARNISANDHLINIPPDRFDNSLRYEIGEIGKAGVFKNAYVTMGGVYTAKQSRVPTKTDEDFAPAPAAYFLLQAEAGTTVYFGKQPVEFGLTGNNLLDTSYRQYLNRFRYFADDMGRLVMFRVKIPLDFSKP